MARRIAIPPAPRAGRPLRDGGTGSGQPAVTPLPVERAAARLAELEVQVDGGDTRVWPQYLETARTLAALLPVLSPAQHRLLTTAELAARLGISPKTLRRRRAMGLARPALEHGRLLRWRADQGHR